MVIPAGEGGWESRNSNCLAAPDDEAHELLGDLGRIPPELGERQNELC